MYKLVVVFVDKTEALSGVSIEEVVGTYETSFVASVDLMC